MYGSMSWSPMTPHHTFNGKAMLVAAFDSSVWTITIPQMGVTCIVDSIPGKLGLVGDQNVTHQMGVRINLTAKFQPAVVRRFKAESSVYIPSVQRSHDEQRRAEILHVPVRGRLYHADKVFIFLHISLFFNVHYGGLHLERDLFLADDGEHE
jgi:hypothetical protein